jgi:hypothetical protein
VSLNIILDDYDTAKKIYDFLKQNGHLMRTIRKGEPNEERSIIALEKHYHDEDPARPCEVIESVESE